MGEAGGEGGGQGGKIRAKKKRRKKKEKKKEKHDFSIHDPVEISQQCLPVAVDRPLSYSECRLLCTSLAIWEHGCYSAKSHK